MPSKDALLRWLVLIAFLATLRTGLGLAVASASAAFGASEVVAASVVGSVVVAVDFAVSLTTTSALTGVVSLIEDDDSAFDQHFECLGNLVRATTGGTAGGIASPIGFCRQLLLAQPLAGLTPQGGELRVCPATETGELTNGTTAQVICLVLELASADVLGDPVGVSGDFLDLLTGHVGDTGGGVERWGS